MLCHRTVKRGREKATGESNPRRIAPPAYKAGAVAAESTRHICGPTAWSRTTTWGLSARNAYKASCSAESCRRGKSCEPDRDGWNRTTAILRMKQAFWPLNYVSATSWNWPRRKDSNPRGDGVEDRPALQGATGNGIDRVGRARVELASLMGSSGLSRGRLPVAPPSESGAKPRSRTGKRRGLSSTGMPIPVSFARMVPSPGFEPGTPGI